MAKSLKDQGVKELQAYKSRVLRQLALGRISQASASLLVNDVDALIRLTLRIDEKQPEKEGGVFW